MQSIRSWSTRNTDRPSVHATLSQVMKARWLQLVDYHTVLKEVWLTTADPAKWMPLDGPLQQHFRRTSMAWKVWSTAWHPKPSLPSGQLLLSCGYLCRESIHPISATNIAYNFGNNSNGSRPNKRKRPTRATVGQSDVAKELEPWLGQMDNRQQRHNHEHK